jgi:hypothetical protein
VIATTIAKELAEAETAVVMTDAKGEKEPRADIILVIN